LIRREEIEPEDGGEDVTKEVDDLDKIYCDFHSDTLLVLVLGARDFLPFEVAVVADRSLCQIGCSKDGE
jgi:hypothetical protein